MFMEQELRRMNEKCQNTFTYVGRTCYARINDDICIRLEFCPSKWDGLIMTILNRNKGAVDSNIILFKDLWGYQKGDSKDELIEPRLYFSTYDRTWDWFRDKPSQSEYDKVAEIIDRYISVYQNMDEALKS